jgi:hypothetical protein
MEGILLLDRQVVAFRLALLKAAVVKAAVVKNARGNSREESNMHGNTTRHKNQYESL